MAAAIWIALILSFGLGMAIGFLIHKAPFLQKRDEHGRFKHR